MNELNAVALSRTYWVHWGWTPLQACQTCMKGIWILQLEARRSYALRRARAPSPARARRGTSVPARSRVLSYFTIGCFPQEIHISAITWPRAETHDALSCAPQETMNVVSWLLRLRTIGSSRLGMQGCSTRPSHAMVSSFGVAGATDPGESHTCGPWKTCALRIAASRRSPVTGLNTTLRCGTIASLVPSSANRSLA